MIGPYGDGYAFVLSICRWHFRKSGKPGQDVYVILFGEESFETNVIVVFVYVLVDCIL